MIHVGRSLRVAARPVLEAALRGPADGRPRPEQMCCAGRHARVVGIVREADETLYRLEGLPGLWREDWLAPGPA